MRKILALLLIPFLPGVLLAQTTATLRAHPLVLTHVTVIDVTGVPAKSDMTVIVAGNRIATVGKTGGVPVPRNAQTVDATGKYLIPGLCDMHAHALLDNTYVWVFPLLVANGVTCIREMGNDLSFEQIRQIREDILKGAMLGPRLAATTAKIMDGAKVGQSLISGASLSPNFTAITTPEEARDLVREYKRQGMDFIKVYNHLSRDEYLAIVDEAKRQKIPFAGHVPNALTAAEVSDMGQRSIEHNWDIFISCSREEAALRQELAKVPYNQPVNPVRVDVNNRAAATYDPKKARVLFAGFVRNDTWMCPTIVYFTRVAIREEDLMNDQRLKYIPAYLKAIWRNQFRQRTGLTPNDVKKFNEERRLEIVGLMSRTGVHLLAGTDLNNAYVFPGWSLLEELEYFAKAGLSPLEALRTATINPAKFLKKEKDFGTIAKGKLADMVLLDANPLEDISNTGKINAVVLNGRFLDRASLDKMLADAEAAANKK